MGGYGSGRPRKNGTVERHRSIDASKLAKQGCFKDGLEGQISWSSAEEIVAQVNFKTGDDLLHLSFRFRHNEGPWEPIRQSIQIERLPRHFGGVQHYFRCPAIMHGKGCQRRATKLYGAGRYFLCRQCHDLSYASQSETPPKRLRRRADKLRAALGGEVGMAYLIPTRPKGMWMKRYVSIVEEIDHCEWQADVLFHSWLQNRFGGLIGGRKPK